MAELLIQKGADVNIRGQFGNTALTHAAKNGMRFMHAFWSTEIWFQCVDSKCQLFHSTFMLLNNLILIT